MAKLFRLIYYFNDNLRIQRSCFVEQLFLYLKLILVQCNFPSFSLLLELQCMSNCAAIVSRLLPLVVHCRVSPVLCVRRHREMVTRRLYLDQSFIPLRWLYWHISSHFPCNIMFQSSVTASLPSWLVFPRRLASHRGDSARYRVCKYI